MRSAERELTEIERKKQAVDTVNINSLRPRTLADINREKIADLERQIDAETKRLATIRSQLQRSKNAKVSTEPYNSKSLLIGNSLTKLPSKDKSAKNEKSTSKAINIGRAAAVCPIPDGLLPELCKLVIYTSV